MQYTSKLKLKKPDYTDVADIADINENMDVLDEEISELKSHAGSTSNPHKVTKAQVGLGNVDNTSDVNKPISAAVQEALDKKSDKSHTHALDEISETTDKKIMTAAERTKLSGIATGANKTTVDASLSSTSTNPVQNNVIKAELDSITAKIPANYAGSTTTGGAANSAVKLETKRYIDGVAFDGTSSISHIAVCSDAGSTRAKTVSPGAPKVQQV